MALTTLETGLRSLAVKARYQCYLRPHVASLTDWEQSSMSLGIETVEDILHNEDLWCDIYRISDVSDRTFDTSCDMFRMLGLEQDSR